MSRAELLNIIKGQVINDLHETDPTRKDEPLIISGFSTKDGYIIYLKSIPGSDSVAISAIHEPYEAEKKSFMEKLDAATPDSHFEFRGIYLKLDEIRRLSDERRRTLKVGGGANEAWTGTIIVTFDEMVSPSNR